MSYLTGKYSNTVSMLTGFISLCAGLFIMYYATRKIIRSVVEAVMPDNNASLMEIIFTQRKLTRSGNYCCWWWHWTFNSAAR
ncbi:MAG: hypothetical protein ACLR2G_13265 [Phascolarctobacterium faecium]